MDQVQIMNLSSSDDSGMVSIAPPSEQKIPEKNMSINNKDMDIDFKDMKLYRVEYKNGDRLHVTAESLSMLSDNIEEEAIASIKCMNKTLLVSRKESVRKNESEQNVEKLILKIGNSLDSIYSAESSKEIIIHLFNSKMLSEKDLHQIEKDTDDMISKGIGYTIL